MLGEFLNLNGQGRVRAKGNLKAAFGPKVEIGSFQEKTDIVMRHVEEAECLLGSITADISVEPGLLRTVREIKRTQVLEEHVATHGKTLVQHGP